VILIKCCLRCFLVCLESLLRLFNKYAFLIFLQFFLGLFVGLGILSVTLSVVDSAAATLFVCICEEPATLQRNFPELHAYMQQTYAQSNLFTAVHM